MRAEIQPAVGQPLDFRRLLQAPVLPAALQRTASQSATPVAFVQPAVQSDGQLEQRALQVQLHLLRLERALTINQQGAQRSVASLNADAFHIEGRTLRLIQPGSERKALQAIVL
ncbi:hypothetical protein ALO94_201063 [Pseudomonas syringae pv. spinaceae]|uniref:Uncharacterized protein n=1 Tax=Pseudomonas syringae pv. spinaceae TaxID=264459 RepID=A0A0Q0E110_PSESX|nr:hypothetical protein ALO94_201063 [Pseudomonas syringae pv. spinaceae]